MIRAFGAHCHFRTHASQQNPLLDHLVRNQLLWHYETKLPCHPEIDDKLEFYRLHDR
jgi:hypothetical protein